MEGYLLNSFHGHDSLTIREMDNDILFIETSYFDYNNDEFDIHNVVIPKAAFIKGAREFLETGFCGIEGMIIENMRAGEIHISVASSDGQIDWIIYNLDFVQ